jgi:hypothetical protein
MIINDNRVDKNVYKARIGDIIIDGRDTMYLIIINYIEHDYGALNLETLVVDYIESEIERLIEDINHDYVVKEIVPQEKISINIS